MTNCPKCGGRKIIGPKFLRALYPRPERLSYRCFTCGYTEETPTRDATAAQDVEEDRHEP
jgi:DNA-directed RNA polymerase subunit RPC12/RpoP